MIKSFKCRETEKAFRLERSAETPQRADKRR